MIKTNIRFPSEPKQEETALSAKKVPKKGDWNYYDTWQEEHSKSFVVAKMTSADLLQDVHSSLVKAEAEGQTFQSWKKTIKPTLEKKGWLGKNVINPETGEIAYIKSSRLETIYRTNMITSNSAGRYKRQIDMAEDFPYWKYTTAKDNRVREAHKELDGKIFEAHDPFWNTHYPPNGWRCRCHTEILDEGDIEEQGLKVERGFGKVTIEEQEISPDVIKPIAVYKDKGITVKTDPGWGYNPGIASSLEDVAWEKAKTYPSELKTQFLAELGKNKYKEPLYQKWIDKNIIKAEKYINATSKEEEKKYAPIGDNFIVGVLPEKVLTKLKNVGLNIKSPYLAINDEKIVHSVRDKKVQRGQAIELEKLKSLIKVLQEEPTYIDKKNNSIVYLLRDNNFNETEKNKKQISKFIFKFEGKNKNLMTTSGKISIYDIKGHVGLEAIK